MTGSNPTSETTRAVTSLVPFGDDGVAQAARLILAGQPVAVPTETVYGLAADATSAQAVARIYAAKGRPSFNPLIVHVSDVSMAEALGNFGSAARQLAQRFWPGPLTIVVPRSADCPIPDIVTAGLDSIALRCPAHRAMRALISESGRPLAAPSANASGSVSPTSAEHVLATLDAKIALVIDDGSCSTGIESTIVRPLDDRLVLLRPGTITADMLTAATGLPVARDDSGTITAPGQLASHYAPGKPVLLNCLAPPADAFVIGFGAQPAGRQDFSLSAQANLLTAAARLFEALHAARDSTYPRIAIAPIPDEGVGIAINDRLRRAAA